MSDVLFRSEEWRGMSTLIEKAKLPSVLVQNQVNLELSKKLGILKKRQGYKNILTAGLTALNSMTEFVDDNDGRQVLIQDGTGLEESVYTASAYSAISAIANDKRTSGATINQIYPVLWRKELRSGAGMNAATDYPIWYGYLEQQKRFKDTTTIAAGKYLCDQSYKSSNGYISAYTQLIDFVNMTFALNATGFGTEGLDEGTYFVFIAPVYQDYMRGLPSLIQVINESADDKYSLDTSIRVDSAKLSGMPRVTAIDVFVGLVLGPAGAISYSALGSIVDKDFTAYFIERIDLNNDSDYFLELSGTLDATPASEKITFADFATWQTFNPIGLFLYDSTNDETYRITGTNINASDIEFTTLPVAQDTGAATFNFFARWYASGGDYFRRFIYDEYYFQAKTEMFTHLDLPVGDFGIDDVRYQYGVMANNRFWIFGCGDDKKGYYSKSNAPDVFPATNEVYLRKAPKAATSIGNDAIAFYLDGAKRFNVYANANIVEEDDFLDRGCVGQKALLKVNDYEQFGFDYSGPWMLQDRKFDSIGDHLREWWEETLTKAQMDACVILYDRLRERVIYSFPTYTTTPYTTGLAFVFDLRAFRMFSNERQSVMAWWILKTDTQLYDGTIADDLHLLTGSKTKIVDWNTAGTPTETVSSALKLKLLRNKIPGSLKTWYDRIFITIDTDDTPTINMYYDEGAADAVTLNDDNNSILRYIAETLEAEITTSASANSVEISSVMITGTEKGF